MSDDPNRLARFVHEVRAVAGLKHPNIITLHSVDEAHLEGGDTAATDFFRDRTTTELEARFQPIVSAKMEEVGVYRVYEDLVDAYNLLPVDKPEAVDLDAYITDRTTRGIFLMLEKEETKIRKDPAARTTELLRKVFADRSE